MHDVQRITKVLVSTKSTAPMLALVAIDTADSTQRFELNEEMAHNLCAELEHFLTQRPQQALGKAQACR